MTPQHQVHDHIDDKGDVQIVEDINQTQHVDADNTAQLVALAQEYVPGSAEEKALLWKLDRRILVCLPPTPTYPAPWVP